MSMSRIVACVGMSVALGGCLEDKGATIAQCRLEAARQYPEETQLLSFGAKYLAHVRLCMRAEGYAFTPAVSAKECSATNGDITAECYTATSWLGQIVARIQQSKSSETPSATDAAYDDLYREYGLEPRRSTNRKPLAGATPAACATDDLYCEFGIEPVRPRQSETPAAGALPADPYERYGLERPPPRR